MTEGRSFRDLIAWQKAMGLVVVIYHVTRRWPQEELFGLTNQTRRAAVSVPANVAEGQGRSGAREFGHHLSIAHGSLAELETHLLIARDLRYTDDPTLAPIMDQLAEVRRLLRGLIRSLRQPPRPPDS